MIWSLLPSLICALFNFRKCHLGILYIDALWKYNLLIKNERTINISTMTDKYLLFLIMFEKCSSDALQTFTIWAWMVILGSQTTQNSCLTSLTLSTLSQIQYVKVNVAQLLSQYESNYFCFLVKFKKNVKSILPLSDLDREIFSPNVHSIVQLTQVCVYSDATFRVISIILARWRSYDPKTNL